MHTTVENSNRVRHAFAHRASAAPARLGMSIFEGSGAFNFNDFCLQVSRGMSAASAASEHGKDKNDKNQIRMQQVRAMRDLVAQGYAYAVDIRVDAAAAMGDARFVSRMAQIAFDLTGDRAIASAVCRGGYSELSSSAAQLRQSLASCLVAFALLKRGHKIAVRNDRVVVLTQSERAAERVLGSLSRLDNGCAACAIADSACVVDCGSLDIDGLSYQCVGDSIEVMASVEFERRFRECAKHVLARSSSMPMAERRRRLRMLVSGAAEVLALAENGAEVARSLNEWLRSRVALVLWKNWKLYRTKVTELMRLGATEGEARSIAAARKGHWPMAESSALKHFLSYSVLASDGFAFFPMFKAVGA